MQLLKNYKNFQLDITIDDSFFNHLNVFTGESGSGKTTALKLLTTNEKFKNKQKVIMNAFTNFNHKLKVRELISLSKHKKFKKDYYIRLNIEELLDIYINKLSKGEQRRLYFFMCISTPSDMYFFDEPFSYIDEKYKSEIKNIIEELSLTHAVFVFNHHDIFTSNRNVYILKAGKLIDKKVVKDVKSIPYNNDEKEIIFNYKNHVFLKHNAITYSYLSIFTLIICFFALIFSGFNSVNKTRIAIDTLGIFNSQSGIILRPTQINIDKEHLYNTYQIIAENEGLELYEVYHFVNAQTYTLDGKIYSMDTLYGVDNNIQDNQFYSSVFNPYLFKHFKLLNNDKTDAEIRDILKSHDYVNSPVTLTISGILFDVPYNKNITISGISDLNYDFLSTTPVLDFYKSLNPSVYICDENDSIDFDDPALIVDIGLLIRPDFDDLTTYLTYKYDDYVFDYQDNLIVATNYKNISIDDYETYFETQDDIFAYRYGNTNYYCLKDKDFLIDNNFNYTGKLSVEENDIIVSKNFALSYFEETEINDDMFITPIIINDKEWNISAILMDVNDNYVYFNNDNYINYIAPKYSFSVYVSVNDFTKIDKINEQMNTNIIGFESKTNINNNIDYVEHMESLKAAKNNLSNLETVFILCGALTFLLLLVFAFTLIVQSYRLYTTLTLLYINTKYTKLINVLVGAFISIVTALIFIMPIKLMLEFSLFDAVLKELNIFDIRIDMKYNFLYLLLSFVLIIVGEYVNGEKIQSWFNKTKLFSHFNKIKN